MKPIKILLAGALFVIASTSLSANAFGQSKLPMCPTQSLYRHNCYGVDNMKNGDRYEGEFRYGRRHGNGKYFLKKGDRYEGEFADDQMNGQGTYFWADGSKYSGEFKEGRPHGTGNYEYKNGDVFAGIFLRGQKNGKGTYKYSDGRKYVGDFKADKRHGQGILYAADGIPTSAGRWKNDKFVREN